MPVSMHQAGPNRPRSNSSCRFLRLPRLFYIARGQRRLPQSEIKLSFVRLYALDTRESNQDDLYSLVCVSSKVHTDVLETRQQSDRGQGMPERNVDSRNRTSVTQMRKKGSKVLKCP